ncbi:MAG TPA: hypothetical protein VK968_11875, partial [Roseimicrobium sp.]|nr:hypothetical protein [Roseimicrobium sp.]
MTGTAPTYKKLPGRGIRTDGVVAVTREYCTLWFAEDHLLSVNSVGGYSERYKRFYFHDIQGFVIQQTTRRSLYNWICGVIGGMLLLGGLIAEETVWQVTLLVLSSPLLIVMSVNSLLGPTCKVFIKTAVQTEELPSLGRLRSFNKALALLQPLIEANQGALSAGEVVERVSRGETVATFQPPVHSGAAMKRSARGLRHESGLVHLLLYVSCIIGAPVLLIRVFHRPSGFTEICLSVMFLSALLALLASLRQQGTTIPAPLQQITKVTLVGLILIPIALGIYALVNWPDLASTFRDGISLRADPALFSLSVLLIAFNFIVGVIGFLWVRQHRTVSRTPPPVP